MNAAAPQLHAADLTLKSLVPGRLRVKLAVGAFREVFDTTDALIAAGLLTKAEANPVTGSLLLRFDSDRHSEQEFAEQLLEHWGLNPEERECLLRDRSVPAPPRAVAPSPTIRELLSTPFQIKSDLPGRLRVQHVAISTYSFVAQRLDVLLMNLGGVISYSVNGAIATVLVQYDEQFLPRTELLDVLESTLIELAEQGSEEDVRPTPLALEPRTLRLTLSSATLAIAVTGWWFPMVLGVATAATIVASSHILFSASRSLVVERKLRVDVLDATVIGLAIAYRKLFPAAFMIWVVDISNVLLGISEKASRRRLAEIFGRQRRKAHRLEAGHEVVCKVADLKQDDVIVVRSGEQIPVDGVVINGDALVDQSALTGEYAPAERTIDERVHAMSVVMSGKLHVAVTRTGAETNAARMIGLIEQSFEHKVRLQSVAEQFADMMVLPTLTLGGIGYGLVGPNAMMAVVNADFGTGIRIAGPLAMLSSLSAAVKHGILIKKGSVLESLDSLNAVVFDKTGTLTEDVPAVHRVIPLQPGLEENALLARVACAEQRFSHPIARAILSTAAERNLELPAVVDSDYEVGFGIRVAIEGEIWKVGSRRFMEAENVQFPARVKRYLDEIHAAGGAAVFAAEGRHLVGLVDLRGSPRPEARQVIDYLRAQRGIEELYLISGDHEAPTRSLAKQLGIDQFFAEVLPQDKARFIKSLQQRGLKVAMVGDGINDTAGLAQADCSISLRGAADAATDIADIVFLDGNLARFELLFQIGDNLKRNVRRSFGLVLVPNSICIAGALLGYFGLSTSLLLNNVFNLIATGNGLRAQNTLARTPQTARSHVETVPAPITRAAVPELP